MGTTTTRRLLLGGGGALAAVGIAAAAASGGGEPAPPPAPVVSPPPSATSSPSVSPSPSVGATLRPEVAQALERLRRRSEAVQEALRSARPTTTAGPTPAAGPQDLPLVLPTRPAPAPPPAPERQLSATWSTLGGAVVGDSVQAAGAALGVVFDDVVRLTEECSLVLTADSSLGVVATDPGGVRVFVMALDGTQMVSGTGTPVGVGSTLEQVRAAFPDWYSGSEHPSRAGGERALIAPRALRGSAALFEADEAGVVRQFRVGDSGYVGHTDYCTTPE